MMNSPGIALLMAMTLGGFGGRPDVPANPLAEGVRSADRDHFLSGLIEAEALRRQLLDVNDRGRTTAEMLADAIIRFQNAAAPHLRDRPGLDRFELSSESLVARIAGAGRPPDAGEAFEPFSGRWHGLWDHLRVDHDWSRAERFDPPRIDPRLGSIRLLATQSAWIGDGFGWNVIAGSVANSGSSWILGTVYHVEDGDRDRVRLHRPHVGVAGGPGQLIWITEGEVFLEEIRTWEGRVAYVITGFHYEQTQDAIQARGDAFQAIYSRDPDDRPAWFSFPIELQSTGGGRTR